ncbi:MAG TPA: hypothetical protein VN944_10720 [Nitrospiria bacterium]|nr:hypothetical protein [Nitrospiria bacterium]
MASFAVAGDASVSSTGMAYSTFKLAMSPVEGKRSRIMIEIPGYTGFGGRKDHTSLAGVSFSEGLQ